MRVGTSGDYPPFSLDGEGFDVEVAQILAAELGARIEWVEFRWPELVDDVAANRFDVAMSGVTWRPERAVVGRMSLAVASGGPCVLGDRDPGRVAVNRGGVLERWARQRFSAARIDAVSDNRTLPERLARGEVDAIVTDSFEVAHFRRPGFSEWCEPPRDRKVYWISPAVAGELAAPIDRFLRDHEAEIGGLRGRYFEEPAPREEVDHLIDLIARRLAFMPAVAAWKRRNGRPIVDSAREQLVLEYADRVSATPVDVPDDFFAKLSAVFCEEEIVELTAHIAQENYNAKSNRPLRVEANDMCEIPLPSVAD